MGKIQKISELINSGKTFTGLDIKIEVSKSGDVSVQNKDKLNILEENNSDDLFTQFQNDHCARGVMIKNISADNLNELKEVFGPLCNYKLNEIRQYDVTIITKVDKKSKLEKAVEASFNITGGAVAVPGGIIATAGEKIVEGGTVPITLAVMGAGVTVPAAIIGALSLGAGTALSLVPKLADKIADKFNGDEREMAIKIATDVLENNLSLHNVPSVKEIMEKVKENRQEEASVKNKKTM